MKVFEGRYESQRVIIGVDEKYLRICSANIAVDLHEVSTAKILEETPYATSPVVLPVSIRIQTDKIQMDIEGLKREDADLIVLAVQNKAAVTKKELTEILRRDVELGLLYRNMGEEDEQMFYSTFAERIVRSATQSDVDVLDTISGKKKAKFILSSTVLMQVFFSLSLSFGEFVRQAFSGCILSSGTENEVDKQIFNHMNRTSSTVERLNVRSFLLQSIWDTPQEPEPEDKNPRKAPEETQDVLNPMLLRSRKPEKKQDPTKSELKTLQPLPALSLPQIETGSIEAIPRINIPRKVLVQMRDLSRIVWKNKAKRELLERAVTKMEQTFKEDTRRNLSSSDGHLASQLLAPILPSRFLRKEQ